jgi:glycosyltransferase involved in cell wall biosynthesis
VGVEPRHLDASADTDAPGSSGSSKRSLRILEVATEAPPCKGGISRTVGYLADGLRKRGHVVDVLAYPEVPRLRIGEIRLSSMCLQALRAHRTLSSYDILHVHGVTPTLSDVALLTAGAVPRRPPVVYTHHADLDLGRVKWPSEAYNRLYARLTMVADVIACSTPEATKRFPNNCPKRVIPLGIDLCQFKAEKPKPETFTVMYVGQFRPWKSVPVLLQAVARIPGLQLIIAGTGPEEKTYRRMAAGLGLDVEFRIGVDDDALSHLYQRAHAVVVPSTSRLEAFGLALIEGMAAGCIPVASDLPGVRDVVEPIGFTFPPGDVTALADILQKLQGNPDMVSEIGQQARGYASHFSRDHMVSAYEQLFLDLVRTHPGGRRAGKYYGPSQ